MEKTAMASAEERFKSPARRSRPSLKMWRSRFLSLLGFLVCSPVIILLSILSFPIVLLSVRWTRQRDVAAPALPPPTPPPPPAIDVVPLLNRYLDDQMGLVRSATMDCCSDGGGDLAKSEQSYDSRCDY